MPLSTPIIRGPLTEWSQTILVEGCLPGATVIIESKGSNPRTLAKGIANGGSDRLELLPGQKLDVKDKVVVTQQLGSEKCPIMSIDYAMVVGPSPIDHKSLPPISIYTNLWECGKAVWIKGAFQGAQVIIQGPNGVLGKGQATEKGDARIKLTTKLPGAGQIIKCWQEAPIGFPTISGVPKKTKSVINALPVFPQRKFPVPTLGGELPKECDTSMPISGIIDGAEVTVKRLSDGLTKASIFDFNRLNHRFMKPLPARGDHLEVTQAMPWCREFNPSLPLQLSIEPMQITGTPEITSPCNNTIHVYAKNLVSEAIAELTYMGIVYRAMIPQNQTTFKFSIVPVQLGQTVSIKQKRCGLVSEVATATVVGNGGTGADLVDPLFECARAVRIRTEPGTQFQVWTKGDEGPRAISDVIYATQDSMQVAISPYLIPGYDVYIRFQACGASNWIESVPRPVRRLEQEIAPVNITIPLVKGVSEVTVDGIPGSQIDVYAVNPIMDEQLGRGIIDPFLNRVGLVRSLTEQDQVYAKQSLCTWSSVPGPLQGVLPNIRVFYLASPLERLSKENNPKPLVCSYAKVICRHDGSWEISADLKNLETKADCDFILSFSVNGVSSPFGIILEGSLSAFGNGPITKSGLGALGVPSSKNFPKPGHFDGFRDPVYWNEFLNAIEKFELIPTFRNYQPTPEDPRDPPGDDSSH
ncbi:TPA: hypothetical protein QCX16_003191 [Bacillus toyonensis]|nr:hypothetical protein [Bacillus toyonensis]